MFAPVKKMWYYKGVYESSGRGNMGIEDIRRKYGSKNFNSDMKYYLSGNGTIPAWPRKNNAIAEKKLLHCQTGVLKQLTQKQF